jgi:hypothetical protein
MNEDLPFDELTGDSPIVNPSPRADSYATRLGKRGHLEIEPANCPHCGTKITTITRGRTDERSPVRPATLNCGHPGDNCVVKWIEDGQ